MAGYGRVILENRFKAFGGEFDRALTIGLSKVGHDVANEVHAANSKYRIRTILGTTDSTPVTRTLRGKAVGIRSEDFRFIFFEKGTYSGRRGKLKRGGGGGSNRKGVTAGRFMWKALRDHRDRLNEYVRAQMGL